MNFYLLSHMLFQNHEYQIYSFTLQSLLFIQLILYFILHCLFICKLFQKLIYIAHAFLQNYHHIGFINISMIQNVKYYKMSTQQTYTFTTNDSPAF